MRRILPILALTATSIFPLTAQETQKPAEPPRFVFFFRSLVAQNSVKAKKVFAELETTQKNLSDKLKTKAEEIQKLQQQLQGASLTEQGRELLKRQGRDAEFEYTKLQEDSQAEFNKVQDKAREAFFKLAGPIIEAMVKEQKLQLVLDGETAGGGQLITWADDAWVKAFSLEVAKRLDASETPAASPAAPTKPGVPPAAKPVVKKP